MRKTETPPAHKAPIKRAELRECINLGEVTRFILENYDLDQPISTTGIALLGAYLKNAKKK